MLDHLTMQHHLMIQHHLTMLDHPMMPDHRAMLDHPAVPDDPNKALKRKGALGNIPEEPPLPEGIPDEVKEKISKPKVPTGGRP